MKAVMSNNKNRDQKKFTCQEIETIDKLIIVTRPVRTRITDSRMITEKNDLY